MVVLLVTLLALLLVVGDFHLLDAWDSLRHAQWDPKSSNGMVAIVLVSLPVECWCLHWLFRPRLTLRGAARWVLTNAAAAFVAGIGVATVLASPLLDSLRFFFVVSLAILLELSGTSALVTWLWNRRSISGPAPDKHPWRGTFVRFVVTSTVSAAVAVGVGWSWHLAYDWWPGRQYLLGG